MSIEDKQARRRAEREIAKRDIDNTLLTVQVINSVCYLGGRVSALRGPRGEGVDLEEEMDTIVEILENLSEINDVVNDANYLT